MISLKTEQEAYCEPCSSTYGWGTSISLSEDQVEALGLKDSPPGAGTVVGIHAIAIVTGVDQNVDAGDDDDEKKVKVCLRLQLTDMEITGATGSATGSASLY